MRSIVLALIVVPAFRPSDLRAAVGQTLLPRRVGTQVFRQVELQTFLRVGPPTFRQEQPALVGRERALAPGPQPLGPAPSRSEVNRRTAQRALPGWEGSFISCSNAVQYCETVCPVGARSETLLLLQKAR